MRLERLEQLVIRLKSLQGDDINTIKGRLDLLNEASQIIHRLRFIAALELALEKIELGESQDGWNDEQEGKQLKPIGKYRFREDLSRFKPRQNRAERQRIALEVCDALLEVEIKVKQHLEANGYDPKPRLWSMWMLALYNRYSDMKLQDFFDPAVPSRRDFSELPIPYRDEWLKGIDHGRVEHSACVGYEVLNQAESERQKERWERDHSIKPLADELNKLEPPLTWGETIFHYISYLTESGGGEALKELDEFFPAKRHCIECGKFFEVDKYNPGRYRCKTCSTRLRVQRFRKK